MSIAKQRYLLQAGTDNLMRLCLTLLKTSLGMVKDKNYPILITLILIMPLVSYSQWSRINLSYTNQDLMAVYATNAHTAYATGAGGIILKTSDAGKSWTKLNSGSTKTLQSVFFTDSLTGYVAGDGSMLKTINGGASWTQLPGASGYYTSSVFFPDKNTGYAVGCGGTIIKTIDAGSHWTYMPYDSLYCFYTVFFTDSNTGYVGGVTFGTGFGCLLKTTNGGISWSISESWEALTSLSFPAHDTGYAVGSGGEMIKTYNAGNSWTDISTGTSYYLSSVFFTNTNNGYITGSTGTGQGVLLKTNDGGATWITQLNSFPDFLNCVCFPDKSWGLVSGGKGTLLTTSNGGSNWTISSLNPNLNLNSVYFTDTASGTVVGEKGLILSTKDGGKNWMIRCSGTEQDLNSVFFPSPTTGYAVGGIFNLDESSSAIALKTTDGGDNWNGLYFAPAHDLNSVYFINEQVGYIVGWDLFTDPRGAVFKTYDGGLNWVTFSVDAQNQLNAVTSPDANTAYAAGEGGKILKTTDGGANWTIKSEGYATCFTSLWFFNKDTGFMTSYDYETMTGNIHKTTDGGTNWDYVQQGLNSQLCSICFTDTSRGYAVGTRGMIMKTIDGGSNWTSQTGGLFHSLRSVSFANRITGYIVGDSAVILKTSNGGVAGSEEKMQPVSSYSIYPDPASTKITIVNTGAIKNDEPRVVIYNSIGKQIMNEQIINLPAEIDISLLPSGIYLLNIISKEAHEIKKLIKL
jgi:photosystem II stability/assembly factor-like uncharacterized protein